MNNEIYLSFEYDPNKNRINVTKHDVSFAEASSVFLDPNALFEKDVEHSNEEERFIILGLSNKSRLLIVCHCVKESEDIVRIISARKANRKESEKYYKFNNL